jgi:murein DD-endopeptidase MepM/ murein hydrolase activator NlpD
MHLNMKKAVLAALFANLVVWILMILVAEKSLASASSLPGSKDEAAPDIFESYLQAEIPPADGFDFPVGNSNGRGSYRDKKTNKKHNGWYVATKFGDKISLGIHPGEDWNGKGGGNTDLGQPVYSIGNGKVVFADDCGKLWGKVVIIQHVFYENHLKKNIRSVYAHLDSILVKKDELVVRRKIIGSIGRDPDQQYYAHLHLELRRNENLSPTFWPSSNSKSLDWVRQNYCEPSSFIKSHRQLFVPQKEEQLVLIDQAGYQMRHYKDGKTVGEYAVSFGQAKGKKVKRGDNKTPKGMYFVIDKRRGDFGGDFGAYYGGHWIKINYPNRFDAQRGRKLGFISATREKEIRRDWRRRKPTYGKSKLGGGIGFHGWIEEWEDSGPRHLSWGCIVMHNRDIKGFYEQIPTGSMVVIF